MIKKIKTERLEHFKKPLVLSWERKTLHFKHPIVTSRGVLRERSTCIITAENPWGIVGRGECCVMPGLLPEPTDEEMNYFCTITNQRQRVPDAPSPIRFGLECAVLAAMNNDGCRWNTDFMRGEASIPIHHLIWMDSIDNMLAAMQRGIDRGFTCLKMKVGAHPFKQELEMLRQAHAAFPQAELRVDANGAFSPTEALGKLEALAKAGVSWIEQPIRRGMWFQLRNICREAPLRVALDEELIQAPFPDLLDEVQPQGIVIKPSLHGGLVAAQQWAQAAEERDIQWWVNSALESSVGLEALAEWCSYVAPGKLQGLGTGQLYTDDSPKRLMLRGNSLWMRYN